MRRRLLVALSLVFAANLVLGAGSFTSVSATRDVEVDVVSDAEAYLGVVPRGFDRCGKQRFLTLYNQFGGNATLAVDVRVVDTEGRLNAVVTDAPATLGAGSSVDVEGRLTPTDGEEGDESLTLAIGAVGDGVEISTQRTYPVACAKSEPKQSEQNSSA
ncbi:MAG: hypothetical protein ABEJ82_05595 [Haloplanus sp.]